MTFLCIWYCLRHYTKICVHASNQIMNQKSKSLTAFHFNNTQTNGLENNSINRADETIGIDLIFHLIMTNDCTCSSQSEYHYKRATWQGTNNINGRSQLSPTTQLGVLPECQSLYKLKWWHAPFIEVLRHKPGGSGFDSRWCQNLSDRSMSLGSTHPLTELNTRNISGQGFKGDGA